MTLYEGPMSSSVGNSDAKVCFNSTSDVLYQVGDDDYVDHNDFDENDIEKLIGITIRIMIIIIIYLLTIMMITIIIKTYSISIMMIMYIITIMMTIIHTIIIMMMNITI